LHPGAVLAVTLLVVSAWLLDGGPGLLTDLALVALVPAVLAGLATLHAVVGARGGRVGWLVALYALLFMALPQLAVALAALGLVNVWLDLGGRMARPPPPGAGRDSDD
jgi:hypothetical protein